MPDDTARRRFVYRHGDHAGNLADVHKHAVLAWLMRQLTSSGASLRVLDTHAGDGLYPLEDEGRRALMDRLLGAERVPDALIPYLEVLRALQRTGEMAFYPGSPWLMRTLLRPGDRLVLAETGREAIERLRRCFCDDDGVEVRDESGWDVLARWPEQGCGCGLVLVDPPYVQSVEYDLAVRGLLDAGHRWPDGCLYLWHPLLDTRHEPMTRALCAAFPGRVLQGEWRFAPLGRKGGMGGSAILMVNPPDGFAPALERLQRWLREHLSGGSVRVLGQSGA